MKTYETTKQSSKSNIFKYENKLNLIATFLFLFLYYYPKISS